MALLEFWNNFQKSFVEQIDALSDSELTEAWKSSKNRTYMYERKTLGSVAQAMGMTYIKEKFKIDYTFCRKADDGEEVPLVFIESENNAFDAKHEMRKLCCLSSPLKVLITCVEWSDEEGYWKRGGNRKKLTDEWSKIISSHNSIWPQAAVTGVLIAEKNNHTLRFYSLVYGPNGSLIKDSEVVFERKLG